MRNSQQNHPKWKITRIKNDGSSDGTSEDPDLNNATKLFQAPLRFLKTIFLPLGYPNSVHPGYLEYQFYDSLQGYCSYVRGVTCLQHILQAAGVGDASKTPYQAAILWIFQEGFAIVFGLVFAGILAPYLDVHVQLFRFAADVLNNVGLTLDMCTTLVPPSALLYLVSVSSVSKSLCGLFAGATKAHITAHFAKKSLADVHAKEGTQESLVHLLGMISGLLFGHVLSGAKWTLFSLLTLLHIWSNYRAVACLRLRSLNHFRAVQAMTPLLEGIPTAAAPEQVVESLYDSLKYFWRGWGRDGSGTIRINNDSSLEELVQMDPSILPTSKRYAVLLNHDTVYLVFLENATSRDQIEAFYEALLLRKKPVGALPVEKVVEALTQQGWDLSHVYLGFDSTPRYRYDTHDDYNKKSN